MRRIVVFNRVTADGYFADPEGRLDWFVPDDELDRAASESLGTHGAMLFGRKTYDLFESFWPHALDDLRAAPDPHTEGRRSPALRAMAQWIDDTPKIVFSRTRKKVTWKSSRLAGGLTPQVVEGLKREPGDDMIVFGSGQVVTQLTEHRLVDEYQLIVSPLFAGKGRRMLGALSGVARLELLEARRTAAGNVVLRYARAR